MTIYTINLDNTTTYTSKFEITLYKNEVVIGWQIVLGDRLGFII